MDTRSYPGMPPGSPGRRTPRLRIAQVAPPYVPVPPLGLGGTEWVVSNLTEELVRQGHEVTLFAHPRSVTSAELISFRTVYGDGGETAELVQVARALAFAGEFDVVHNHCLRAGPALGGVIETPCVTTLHYDRPVLHAFPEHPYVAISRRQRGLLSDLNVVDVVYNGVDCAAFPVVESKSEYLLFVGAMDPKKGPDLAIEVARTAGMPLVLAGPAPVEAHRTFFEERVLAELGDGIEYLGEALGDEKIELLSRARAVLCPVRWEEPFGLIAAEAMACGTPVVAIGRGALPEIVPDGIGGFTVPDVDGMVPAIARLNEIEPRRCREWVERSFTPAHMAEGYMRVYRRLLDTSGGRRTTRIYPAAVALERKAS